MSERRDAIPFVKMQGVGNDFVLLDGRELGERDWPALAVAMCARRTGIGADGLLVIAPSSQADLRMRMFNPDGSPDICGNGLRCVSRYAVERGLVRQDSLRIETLVDVRSAQIHRHASAAVSSVTVDMGRPAFDPPRIPMNVSLDRVLDFPLKVESDLILTITALSTGSTHAVTFVDALPDDGLFFSLSPKVEQHPLFPERTSLMWCRMERPSRSFSRIDMRIWERGAGETWGCGTGACAAAVAALAHGYAEAGEPVIVASRGGELLIRWREGEDIRMTGPAEFVFEGLYPLPEGKE
ncbi:MAG TPA: diaminopimelate epimerase [Chthonomonadaceae bacterium]|nr:diaminopimelate epimerase [Chthonomonadaceae bacterium]